VGLGLRGRLVLLIFVHEMGHAVALAARGHSAGAPVFIPFVGAFVAMHGQPRDAAVEARVAMAGPDHGLAGGVARPRRRLAWPHPLLVALGHTAVLLNLFNLVPVPPLDGGRIAGAFTRTYWVLGYALGTGALLLTRSPLLLVVLILGLFTLVRRWRDPVPGYDALSSRQARDDRPRLRRARDRAARHAAARRLSGGPDMAPTPPTLGAAPGNPGRPSMSRRVPRARSAR